MKHILFFFLIALIASFATMGISQAQGPRHGRAVVTTRPAHPIVGRQAHVHYAAMPRFGASINVVPQGAVAVRRGGRPYYYHSGVYYEHRNNGYLVVRPSRGLRVTVLPMGYRTIAVGPRSYYYYYGTYYQSGGNGYYTVVNPPIGAVVDSLPDGYSVENINGTEYYYLDGVTYAEVDAPEFPDGVGFEVVRN